MQFGFKFFAVIQKTHAGKSLQLSLPSASIRFLQPFEVTDLGADSDNFDIRNFADDLEVHGQMMLFSIIRYKLECERLICFRSY
jgi:hypothetical protein